jgi:protein gp37
MSKTSIGWTDYSWSPIRARNKETGRVFHFCERISPGCQKCYAATMARRFGLPDYVKANRDKVEFFLDEEVLRQPLHWKKPRRVFVESSSDLFGDWAPDEWLDRVFAVMALRARHQFQVLTKRPERMREYVCGLGKSSKRIEKAALSLGWTLRFKDEGRSFSLCPWPLPSVWLGVSVESQKYADERIPHLLQTPAAVRFLSCEPLLSAVSLECSCFSPTWNRLYSDQKIHWVIAGGESGAGCRPCQIEWLKSIIAQCKAANVPVFNKQLGGNPRWQPKSGPCGIWPEHVRFDYEHRGEESNHRIILNDRKGADPSEWPTDLVVQEFPA